MLSIVSKSDFSHTTFSINQNLPTLPKYSRSPSIMTGFFRFFISLISGLGVPDACLGVPVLSGGNGLKVV
jgi:hypothetical protein